MSYSKPREQAAFLVASTIVIPTNAKNERAIFKEVAYHGGYGYGQSWVWGTKSQARKLLDKLVERGLLVDMSSGHVVRYVLAPEEAEKFALYAKHFEGEAAKERAVEAAREAAEQALHRFAVVTVDLATGASTNVGEIYAGAKGEEYATNQAKLWEAPGVRQVLVVRLADAVTQEASA